MFAKIIIGILAFLLWLFPSWKSVLADYQSRTFDSTKAATAVIDAITARDVAALEAMMCKNIVDNVSDLPGEIGKLYDAIGDLNGVTTRWSMGVYSGSRDGGKRISQSILEIHFSNSDGDFAVFISWETVNNFSPDEKGIRSIALFDKELHANAYEITATEGTVGWHD